MATLAANERRAQDRHHAQMMTIEQTQQAFATWVDRVGSVVQFPPHHPQIPRAVFGNNYHNMSELEHPHHPQLLGFTHPSRLRHVPLLPAPRLRHVPLLPAPLPGNQLAITTIDSEPPSTPVRSQQTADQVRAQTPTSAPPKKKLKVSEAAAPGGNGVAQMSPPPPIPSFDAVTIRAVVEEWSRAHPPYCSLRDMMKGEGKHFDAWRKHWKSRIDHRKNIWWAITEHAKELEAESHTFLDEVARRLEEQKDEMEKKMNKKMTIDQFTKALPSPPKGVWRFQL